MVRMAYFCGTKVNILKGFNDLFRIFVPILNRLQYSKHSTGNNSICQMHFNGPLLKQILLNK
jgi:hypothetical protein